MLQRLHHGHIRHERPATPDTPWACTGRKLYLIGDIDGGFRPRSNPYDMEFRGSPHPEDPLAGKLQGVWAQPVRGFDGYTWTLRAGSMEWQLDDAAVFTQTYASVQFDYSRNGLSAQRSDFVPLDLPVAFTSLRLTNTTPRALQGELLFTPIFDLQDAWFTHFAPHGRNSGQRVQAEDDCLAACAVDAPSTWGAAAGSPHPHQTLLPGDGSLPHLVFPVNLDAGQSFTWSAGLCVIADPALPGEDGLSAHQVAISSLLAAFNDMPALLAEKEAAYAHLLQAGPRLDCPDRTLNDAFDIARANLLLLEAAPNALGPCLFAGLDMFPFWFSNDTAYSTPGLLINGQRGAVIDHMLTGMAHMDETGIPHQISPSGQRAFRGNAQETAQWVQALWDIYRYTADNGFLRQVYPAALRGLLEYTLGSIDPDGDGYPSGPGMVEMDGMGEEKLDSAAYAWQALQALTSLAEAAGEPITARLCLSRADEIAARFDDDWWDDANGTYAMSLNGAENIRQFVPHWAIITPLEVGLASPDHARTTLATLQNGYLGPNGLKHTVGESDHVWTLPTVTLSRAAYRYNRPDLGLRMLLNVTRTLEAGSIGLYHELIPTGFCFVQLWSAATLLRGVVEDLLGLWPLAHLHELRVAPQLPREWSVVELNGFEFGGHVLNVRFTPDALHITHRAGPSPLTVEYLGAGGVNLTAVVPPGESACLTEENA